MKMLDELQRTVVFIGRDQESKQKNKYEDTFIGTGFLLNIEDFFFISTAKHVVFDTATHQYRRGLWAAVRLVGGRYKKVYFDDIKDKYHVDWIAHKAQKYDIALLPMELDNTVDEYRLLPKDVFYGIGVGQKPEDLTQLVFCSFQPGIEKIHDISPVLRTGFIARKNKDKTILIDANTFPGNSGSPVFVAPTVGYVDPDNNVQLGNPLSGRFVGVISGYIPYSEAAISTQTGKPRVVFEENTGIAVVHTYEILNEIVKSKPFKQLIKSLRSFTTST